MRYLNKIGINSKKAFEKLKKVDHKKIQTVLQSYSNNILKNKKLIIKENIKDIKNVKRKQLIDRLVLNESGIEQIRSSINEIIKSLGSNPDSKIELNSTKHSGIFFSIIFS